MRRMLASKPTMPMSVTLEKFNFISALSGMNCPGGPCGNNELFVVDMFKVVVFSIFVFVFYSYLKGLRCIKTFS